MTLAQAMAAIQKRWAALWPAASGNVPYVFENDVADEQATYARVRITSLEEVQQTFGNAGNRKFLNTGVIEALLFLPGNAGREPADLLVGKVRDVFQVVRFGMAGTEEGVVTYATSDETVVGKGSKGSTIQYRVVSTLTPFEFFDVR